MKLFNTTRNFIITNAITVLKSVCIGLYVVLFFIFCPTTMFRGGESRLSVPIVPNVSTSVAMFLFARTKESDKGKEKNLFHTNIFSKSINLFQ